MKKKSLYFGLLIFVLFYGCNKKESTKDEPENSQKTIVIEKLLETEKSWDGANIPPQNIANPKVTVLRIRVKKGTKLSLHKHTVINVGYMLEGSLTVHKKTGESVTLNKGDSLVEVINQWHYGENIGNQDAVIVVFYVGEKDQPLTILKDH